MFGKSPNTFEVRGCGSGIPKRPDGNHMSQLEAPLGFAIVQAVACMTFPSPGPNIRVSTVEAGKSMSRNYRVPGHGWRFTLENHVLGPDGPFNIERRVGGG